MEEKSKKNNKNCRELHKNAFFNNFYTSSLEYAVYCIQQKRALFKCTTLVVRILECTTKNLNQGEQFDKEYQVVSNQMRQIFVCHIQ